MQDLRRALLEHFGFAEFRNGQEAVVAALVAGRSALALFPTGAGKSLCCQLPALLREGTALVISPLVALMKDQAEALQCRGIAAERLDSTLSPDKSAAVEAAFARGALRLLFLSPERFGNDSFANLVRGVRISLLAVDEAHCIAEWGHNFRPDYLRIAAVARKWKLKPVLALTATARPQAAAEIRKAFGILKQDHFQTSFHRPNLHFRVTPCTAEQRLELLEQRLSGSGALPAIVYVTRQETAEAVTAHLQKSGIAARAYHAGLPGEQRTEAQDCFMSGQCPVIVATIAFGMGIDKADIRSVIHFNLPKSLENYLQETGRAGRDGLPARCEWFACGDDRVDLENIICGAVPTPSAVRQTVEFLLRQGETFDVSLHELSRTLDIHAQALETILARLELRGLLRRDSVFFAKARVTHLASQTRTLSGMEPPPRRLMENLFAQGVPKGRSLTIDLAAAAAKLRKHPRQLGEALRELEAAGEIRLELSGLRQVLRTSRRSRPDPQAEAADLCVLFARREEQDLSRIDEMLAYAAQPACSTRWLLEKFGEKLPEPCGHCANCLSPPDRKRAIPCSPVRTITAERLHTVQHLLAERHPALRSPRQLARFLCGIASPAVLRDRLTRHDAFGLLNGLPFQEVLLHMETLPL
ncbi:MAG: RecQ family ATP-dependent DNA helicase [Verrucomicrobiales bacterium]|nr:RecQ family ATP-dependent DNA helicase [Verrucomicrobiales bacterium]